MVPSRWSAVVPGSEEERILRAKGGECRHFVPRFALYYSGGSCFFLIYCTVIAIFYFLSFPQAAYVFREGREGTRTSSALCILQYDGTWPSLAEAATRLLGSVFRHVGPAILEGDLTHPVTVLHATPFAPLVHVGPKA